MSERLTISDDLAVGRNQPSETEIEALAAAGFRAVLDLRRSGEPNQALPPDSEAAAVERNGMTYRHLPTPTDRLSDDALAELDAALADLPKPVLVHCASGKRSGTAALMHQAIAEGWSGAEMARRAEALGVAYGPQDQRDAIAAYIDGRQS